MKKNIIIGVLLITTILSLIYGFVQKSAARVSLVEAEQQKRIAQGTELAAVRSQEQFEVMVQENELQKAKLAECMKSCGGK